MDTRALLNVWDAGQVLSPERWAVKMLAAADRSASADSYLRWRIGARDAALLRVRSSLFGSRLVAGDRCPHCGTLVDVPLETAQLICPPDAAPSVDVPIDVAGCRVRCRAADTLDLLAIADCADAVQGERLLRERCIQAQSIATGVPIDFDSLPPEAACAALERIEVVDPQANVQLALHCPDCGAFWQAAFDIVAFLWHELDAWANRLLHEVHQLALAYGWSEGQVLALSAPRRQRYLRMCA